MERSYVVVTGRPVQLSRWPTRRSPATCTARVPAQCRAAIAPTSRSRSPRWAACWRSPGVGPVRRLHALASSDSPSSAAGTGSGDALALRGTELPGPGLARQQPGLGGSQAGAQGGPRSRRRNAPRRSPKRSAFASTASRTGPTRRSLAPAGCSSRPHPGSTSSRPRSSRRGPPAGCDHLRAEHSLATREHKKAASSRVTTTNKVLLAGRGAISAIPADRESYRRGLADDCLCSDPGSPWQNPFVESFHSYVRDELLDVEEFSCLAEGRVVIADW